MGVAFKLRIFQEILVMGFFDWPIIPKKHSHYEHIQIDHTAFLFKRAIAMNSPLSQVCFSNLYLTSAVYYSVSGGHKHRLFSIRLLLQGILLMYPKCTEVGSWISEPNIWDLVTIIVLMYWYLNLQPEWFQYRKSSWVPL